MVITVASDSGLLEVRNNIVDLTAGISSRPNEST